MDGAEFAVDVMGKMNVDFGAPFSTKSLWGGKLVDNIVGVDSVDFLLKNNNEELGESGIVAPRTPPPPPSPPPWLLGRS